MRTVPASMLLSLALWSCSSGDVTVAPADDGSADSVDTSGPGDTSAPAETSPGIDGASDASDTSVTTDADGAADGDGAPAPTCSDPASFPTFGKGCTIDANCSFGLHQLDCCGSLGAIGINHAFKGDFTATEDAYRKTCSVCDCLPMDTRTESGVSTNDATKIAVRCDVGLCKTYVK